MFYIPGSQLKYDLVAKAPKGNIKVACHDRDIK